jgi:predicted transposase YdaD
MCLVNSEYRPSLMRVQMGQYKFDLVVVVKSDLQQYVFDERINKFVDADMRPQYFDKVLHINTEKQYNIYKLISHKNTPQN